MIWHVRNENFILDSTRIFMKAFHLLLFDGSFIFPECILIFGLILLLMIDSTSDQKDIPWFYFISSTSLVMSITALLFRWREEPMISFSGNFQTNNFNEIFQFLILLCSTLCIPLSVEYIECPLGWSGGMEMEWNRLRGRNGNENDLITFMCKRTSKQTQFLINSESFRYRE